MKWLHLLSMKVINCKYITSYTDVIYTSHVLTIYHIKWLAKIKTKILKTFTFYNLYWSFYYNNFDCDHVLCEVWFKSEVIQITQKVDGQFFCQPPIPNHMDRHNKRGPYMLLSYFKTICLLLKSDESFSNDVISNQSILASP
jgi:hypothetical protein